MCLLIDKDTKIYFSKYALAVEIKDSLFEIFDIITYEINSESDIRYKNGIKNTATAIKPLSNKNIKIGSTNNNGFFESEDKDGFLEVDDYQNVFVFLSDNKVFGLMMINQESPSLEKYISAFESKVILLDISLEEDVGIGDLWDTKEFKNINDLNKEKNEISSKWNQWKKSLGESRPWHLLDPEKKVRSKEIINKRISLCTTCEFFLPTKQCSKCFCFMPAKVHLSDAECPVGKWSKEN
jgi:hypothetical protein